MIRFKTFRDINEGKYPAWVRLTTVGMVARIKGLQTQIDAESDPVKQNKLIAQQNNLLGYINGLTVGVGTDDTQMLTRLKKI